VPDTIGERQRRAVEAACTVLDELGLAVADPVVLKDSNNTVIWMQPSALVAKVGTSTLGSAGLRGLGLELAVLAWLSGRGCPVRGLPSGLPQVLHRAGGMDVLLLEFVEAYLEGNVEPRLAQETLTAVHQALGSYPGRLPLFTDQLGRVRELLSEPSLTPEMSSNDRTLLQGLVDGYVDRFVADLKWRLLHGDPWLGGNLLRARSGAVLLDFETERRGPVESDWSALPSAAAPAGVDIELLDEPSAVRSLTVATWCFAQPGRASDVDAAASYHLSVLKHRTRGIVG
jgi:hypothetical protein